MAPFLHFLSAGGVNEKGNLIPLAEEILGILKLKVEEAFTERQLQGFIKTSCLTVSNCATPAEVSFEPHPTNPTSVIKQSISICKGMLCLDFAKTCDILLIALFW